MARFWSLGFLVISGIIIADILIHPTGTAAAANGVKTIAVPSYNALLGSTSAG